MDVEGGKAVKQEVGKDSGSEGGVRKGGRGEWGEDQGKGSTGRR